MTDLITIRSALDVLDETLSLYPETKPPASETTAPTEATEGSPKDPEDNDHHKEDASHYIEEVYSQQIRRYFAPIWELWDVSMYLENGLSPLPSYYCVGNPLENVGYVLVDLDNDGSWELVIGAILNADKHPSIFEIWTLVNSKPVMLAQGSSDNLYHLQHREDEQTWYVVNEASVNIASNATYYMKLDKGELKVMQGVVFDAFANEKNPWFLTHDLDWDTSNDTPIDGETANAILETHRQLYTAPEYFPYTQYQPGTEQPPQTTPEQMLYKRAAELSQRFGVDIRIPAQNELVYTNYDASALTDLIAIRSALDVLDETLSLYPEGFFRQLISCPSEFEL